MRTKWDDSTSGPKYTNPAHDPGVSPDIGSRAEKGDRPPLQEPEVERSAPVDARSLEDHPRGLELDGRGAGSLFAFRVTKGAGEVRRTRARPLAFEPIATGAKDIDELLARLPLQTEVARIAEVIARRNVEGGIPLTSLPAIEAALPPIFTAAMSDLARLTHLLNPVELYTADDVVRVKDTFLEKVRAGEPENPKLSYVKSTGRLRATLAAHGTSLDELERRLGAMREGVAAERPAGELAGVYRTAILAKIDDDLATIALARGLEGGDDRRVKEAFAVKYGRGVDGALLDAARTVFGYLVENQAHAKKREVRRLGQGSLPGDLAAFMTRRENMSAEEFKGAVEWMLERYYRWYEEKTGEQFPANVKYRVEVDDKYSAIDVRDKSSQGPIIGIPDKTRSYKKYLELLRHEVDQHVRQSLNGQFMFRFGGGALKVDEEVWYEGLAKSAEIRYMREKFGDESEPSLPYFTFAIELAERGKTFVEVFEAIKSMRMAAGNGERTAEDNAWSATYRAFRGHIDTSNPDAYALPKDQAYLRGWMLQSQLEARGLGYLNESAICQLDGVSLLARFDYSAKDLLFPDLNLTERYFDEVLRPRIEAEMEGERREASAITAEDRPAKGDTEL